MGGEPWERAQKPHDRSSLHQTSPRTNWRLQFHLKMMWQMFGSNQTIWDNMLTSMFLYIPQVLSYVLYTCCLRACLNRIPLLNGFAMIMNASIHNHAQYEELEARIAAGDEDALIPGCNYLLYLQNDEACSILEIDLGCTPKCSMEEFGAHFFCRRLPDAFCILHFPQSRSLKIFILSVIRSCADESHS